MKATGVESTGKATGVEGTEKATGVESTGKATGVEGTMKATRVESTGKATGVEGTVIVPIDNPIATDERRMCRCSCPVLTPSFAKANLPGADYCAVLFVALPAQACMPTMGTTCVETGGANRPVVSDRQQVELVFFDHADDAVVAPADGQLVVFTAGAENLWGWRERETTGHASTAAAAAAAAAAEAAIVVAAAASQENYADGGDDSGNRSSGSRSISSRSSDIGGSRNSSGGGGGGGGKRQSTSFLAFVTFYFIRREGHGTSSSASS
jgi:uncharacterized membrane protein YgcG